MKLVCLNLAGAVARPAADGRSDSVLRLRNSSDLAAVRRGLTSDDVASGAPEVERSSRMFICILEPESCSCFLVSVLFLKGRCLGGGGIVIRTTAWGSVVLEHCLGVVMATLQRRDAVGGSAPLGYRWLCQRHITTRQFLIISWDSFCKDSFDMVQDSSKDSFKDFIDFYKDSFQDSFGIFMGFLRI